VVREAQGKLKKARENLPLPPSYYFYMLCSLAYSQIDLKFELALSKTVSQFLSYANVKTLASTCKINWRKKLEEGFFGNCKHSQKLRKTANYLNLLNLHASGHCLISKQIRVG
jgi:hypothetical protein